MKRHFTLTFIISFVLLNLHSQDTTSLALNDKAPALVLPTFKNTVEGFSFPYQNKIVYLHFWSSFNADSKKDFFKYKRIYKQNADVIYKNCDGFDIILVALQDDRKEWENDVYKYNIESLKNFIALKGFNDYFLKKYKLKTLPTGMMINTNGEIIAINPDVTAIKTYIDDNRNYVPTVVKPKELAGKITVGQGKNAVLENETIYVTNTSSLDTIQTITTDKKGDFVIKNADKNAEITLKISNSEKIKQDENLFLKNTGGDVISDFSHTPTGYEYKILPEDLNDLKSAVLTATEAKKVFISENLFTSGGNNLTEDATKKLDIIYNKLNDNKQLQIQITTHTDCKGDAKYNDGLSLKRANVIATYFVKKGIEKNRITTIGKGESEPLNKCVDGVNCTDAELEINRRTEFIIFEK